MQRIKIRFQRNELSSALSHHELRELFLAAAQQAAIPLATGKRTLLMGPPLPAGATSEAEFAVFCLEECCDPSEFIQRLGINLTDGVIIERGWVCQPNSPDDKPSLLDEAVYLVNWREAVASEKITAAIRLFYSLPEVPFTRNRENKIQYFNARDLVHQISLLATRDGVARLQMTLAGGSQGSIRPQEVLEAIGFAVAPDQLQVHRIAMFASVWRKSSYGIKRLQLS